MSMPDLEYRAYMIRHHAERIASDDMAKIIAGHNGVISTPEIDLQVAERRLSEALAIVRKINSEREGKRHELRAA